MKLAKTHDERGLVIYSGDDPCYFKFVIQGAGLDVVLGALIEVMRANGRDVYVTERFDTQEAD